MKFKSITRQVQVIALISIPMMSRKSMTNKNRKLPKLTLTLSDTFDFNIIYIKLILVFYRQKNMNENGIYKLYHSFFLITLVPQGVPNAGVFVDSYFSITFPLILYFILSFASFISILIFFNSIDLIVECGEYILSFIDFTSYSLLWFLSFFDFYLVSFYLLFVL